MLSLKHTYAVQHLPSLQLKQRMKAVGSIGKITKAMKMVSASKMKGDLARLAAGKNYGNQAVDMIFKSDQFMQRKMPGEVADPNIVIVPITSDKGLCGAVNSSIVRQVKKYFAEGHATRSKCQIFSIGEKGTAGLTRPFHSWMDVDPPQATEVLLQAPLNQPHRKQPWNRHGRQQQPSPEPQLHRPAGQRPGPRARSPRPHAHRPWSAASPGSAQRAQSHRCR